MDFLALVRRLATETGTELETKITDVVVPPAASYGTTTEHRSRLVRWIQQAWTDVQEDQEQWDFMVFRDTMDLAENQTTYDIKAIIDGDPPEVGITYDELVPFVAPADLRYVWLNDTRNTPPNRHICYYTPPERFFGHQDRFSDRARGLPSRYSIDRDGCIVFDAKPSSNDLNIEFEFRREPHQLVANSDVPAGIKPRFHEVIVYRAMVFYAFKDEADKQLKRSVKLYRDKMNKLRLRSLRDYAMSGTNT